MTPGVVAAAVVPAAVTATLSFTNPVHGLFWSDPALVTEGPYRFLVVEYTVGWWASAAVSYLFVTAGMVLVAGIAVQPTGLYRGQSLLVLGASVAPTLADVAYHTCVSPVPYLDLTPFGPAAVVSCDCSRTSFETRSNTVRPPPTLMLVRTPRNTVPRAVSRGPATRSNAARPPGRLNPLATT